MEVEKGLKVGVEPNMGCGFAEYVKLDQNAIMHGKVVPFDGISFEEAALAEPLACWYNTLQAVRTGRGGRGL